VRAAFDKQVLFVSHRFSYNSLPAVVKAAHQRGHKAVFHVLRNAPASGSGSRVPLSSDDKEGEGDGSFGSDGSGGSDVLFNECVDDDSGSDSDGGDHCEESNDQNVDVDDESELDFDDDGDGNGNGCTPPAVTAAAVTCGVGSGCDGGGGGCVGGCEGCGEESHCDEDAQTAKTRIRINGEGLSSGAAKGAEGCCCGRGGVGRMSALAVRRHGWTSMSFYGVVKAYLHDLSPGDSIGCSGAGV
jgi:hypothetical protein